MGAVSSDTGGDKVWDEEFSVDEEGREVDVEEGEVEVGWVRRWRGSKRGVVAGRVRERLLERGRWW